MSANYVAILWNKQKKRYDLLLWLGILLFALTLITFQTLFRPNITAETLIIRTTALTAVALLHVILAIGPLARLNTKFLPLLYNRRHMGVSMFFIALWHGVFSILHFHTLGNTNALSSLFLSNQRYAEISSFPFQTLGFLALLIFFIMAITSHDFWLKNLSPKFWKALHMCVYIAYGLIILHVALGALQYESHPFYWGVLFAGFASIAGLHLAAGLKENKRLVADKNNLKEDGFYEVGPLSDIPEKCAKTVFIDNENIAIFKYNGKVSAVHNVCKHQMGPLGEGKVIDDCITCPWHGYQYLPANGQSPPPFTEKVKTYHVKLLKDIVWVNPTAEAEGTHIEPTKIAEHG